ncbi:MAG: Peptidoglycan deacetylase [candidate division WS6 bacterium OLB20]|uniref:Peptidoglycan deacetylase n=1 Tax=candidate division WS6 bacterium OLB20 TaxID=1617426 RepID=A0A136M0L4_9BACT|nr:MAG: Peptidoglycan deacetylase [candidate division WS6 bacterium OLB20]
MNTSKTILLTFDVEEWFHTTFMTDYIDPHLFSVSRVMENLGFVLDLLQEFDITATFFVLGSLAEKIPDLVPMILEHNSSHEIASHSYDHVLLYEQSPEDISMNVIRSREILQKQSGQEVGGFRAPYFSINDHAIEELAQNGYVYDSSLHDFRLNPQYGHLHVEMNATGSPGIFTYKNLFELTIPVKRYFNNRLALPFGGGGYYRLYPLLLQKYWIDSFLKTSDYFMMYLHPWEFDPDQPYVRSVPAIKRMRHYIGIRRHLDKTRSLVRSLAQKGYTFSTVSGYLNKSHGIALAASNK